MQRNPVVFMFSGQGSQYYHMGQELFLQNSIFRHWMLTLNQFVYDNTGLSVIEEIYNENKGKAEKLDQLQISHPAIFMVEYSLARLFIESGIEPDYVLGASLGEFTAAAVAEVISAGEVLEWIIKQVELLPRLCRLGSMIAIIDNPDLYLQTPLLSQGSELAAVNFGSHFVISGDRRTLESIEQFLKTHQKFYQTLPVEYGFHSSNVDPIRDEYLEFLRNFRLNKPRMTMISCVSGAQVAGISPEYIWDVIRQPICFQKAIQELEKRGAYNYIDLGPGGTLAGFTKQNLAKDSLSRCYSTITPFHTDRKNCDRVFGELGYPVPE
jgi:bacillaene synthase trans-acting acyltransferase